MEETYTNLLTIAKLLKDDGRSLSELTVEYQQTKDERIFSKVYCELYHFTRTQLNKYFYLTEEDKISFSLEELNKAMLAYNPEKGAEIQTFYNTYLNRRLYAETSMTNHKKRCINNNAESYEELSLIMEDEIDKDGYKDIVLNDALENSGLSANEIDCCKIIISENHELKNTEIAKRLNITSAGVGYIKEKLKTKLNPILMA